MTASLATPGLSESHRLQPDFTFKRVSVPAAGSGPRITVQIDPNAVVPVIAPAPPPANPQPGPVDPGHPSLGWFWAEVDPSIDASRPGRLAAGLAALGNAPAGQEVREPSLTSLARIAAAHQRDLLGSTIGTRISPALALAVISVESGGRPAVTSHAGAQGLMQLMPATAERFGVTDRTNPGQNIRGGVAYLDFLIGYFDGDPILALAAYNAGEGAVLAYDGVPPYAETRAYVPKVLAAWKIARALCRTPPELISDGCVFSVTGG